MAKGGKGRGREGGMDGGGRRDRDGRMGGEGTV